MTSDFDLLWELEQDLQLLHPSMQESLNKYAEEYLDLVFDGAKFVTYEIPRNTVLFQTLLRVSKEQVDLNDALNDLVMEKKLDPLEGCADGLFYTEIYIRAIKEIGKEKIDSFLIENYLGDPLASKPWDYEGMSDTTTSQRFMIGGRALYACIPITDTEEFKSFLSSHNEN